MTPDRQESVGVRHRAFEARPARPLERCVLSDRARLAVLLEGAAVLAHLEQAGARLGSGWRGATLTADGALQLPGPVRGRAVQPTQEALADLAQQLFEDERAAGRGPARRAARALLTEWRLCLVPRAAHELVVEIFEQAPFLFEPSFGAARGALVAEIERGEGWRLNLAGSAAVARRFLARATDRGALEALLQSAEVTELWRGGRSARPRAQTAPSSEALYRDGAFERALALLAGAREPAERVLRAACLARLGRWQTALTELAALPPAPSAEVLLDACEVAVRCHANLADAASVETWVERARRRAQGEQVPRAQLVAAFAAFDLKRLEAMAVELEAVRRAALPAELVARRDHAEGLLAQGQGRLPAAAEKLGAALGRPRRQLARWEAAGLWNELALVRAELGDLAGTERALRHAVRLFAGCDGPRRLTLAAANLAEIRVRRGRLAGVREVIEQVAVENRLARNLRGQAQDAELAARFELACGRPQAALTLCRAMLTELERRRSAWRREVLRLLAARALGWLGRREAAAAELAGLDGRWLRELEPEERPAVLAHAGNLEAARVAAAEAGLPLWSRLLAGEPSAAEDWHACERLEPWRAARWVFDLELWAPGSVPFERQRRAIETLRRVGATPLAERLEERDVGPWQGLARFLAAPTRAALPALLTSVGHGEAGLLLRQGEQAEVLRQGGAMAGETLVVATPNGELVATTPTLDAAFEVAVRVLARLVESWDLRGSQEGVREPAGRSWRADGIVGRSAALEVAATRLERLGASELPILILGESGTGKELAAKLVHRASPRASRPLVPLNCAAVSENLLLSDLFGHVRGAFTGADKDRAGVFEAAAGGTVFLDEIGDLPLSCQGMLLRLLQEGEVRRVGESLARKVKVRVVAATNRDLPKMIRDGHFREDLYFRLKAATVRLPSLRERREDIPVLVEHFLKRHGYLGLEVVPEAWEAMLGYDWPGNIRELENTVGVAAALAVADGGRLERQHLELPDVETAGPAAPPGGERRRTFQREVEDFRCRLLGEALTAAAGNQAEAARRLGLTRQALSYLARRHKLA